MRDHAWWKQRLADEPLPVAAVDLEAFDRNLAKLASIATAGGKRVRVASKSVRVPALLERVLAHGEPFHGLMCYSAREAAWLHERFGMRDLLVAYPSVQQADIAALASAHAAGAEVSIVVDSPAHLDALAARFDDPDHPFPVLIDVDASRRIAGGRLHIGVRRSPVRTAGDLRALLRSARRHRGLVVRGAMAYEAQVAGLGDANPFKRSFNPVARQVRRRSAAWLREWREEVARTFADEDVALEVFNGGGTGSFDWASRESVLTEVTAGSALVCSHLFDYYTNISFEPALVFALQVVRASDPGYVTCQGGGYIASGEPGWDKVPLPYLPAGVELVSTEATGEVQTPLRVPSGVVLAPGDLVLFRHAKAGELAERFNEYLLLRADGTAMRVPTYRGFGQSFL